MDACVCQGLSAAITNRASPRQALPLSWLANLARPGGTLAKAIGLPDSHYYRRGRCEPPVGIVVARQLTLAADVLAALPDLLPLRLSDLCMRSP